MPASVGYSGGSKKASTKVVAGRSGSAYQGNAGGIPARIGGGTTFPTRQPRLKTSTPRTSDKGGKAKTGRLMGSVGTAGKP